MNGLASLFSEPWVELLGWVLIHFLWQGTGIALLLAVALRLLTRTSSHFRYVVIGGALLLCAVMPVVTWTFLRPIPQPAMPSGAALNLVDVPKVEAPFALISASSPDAPMASPGNVPTQWQDHLSRLANASLPYVVGLWFAGVLALTLRLTLVWTLMRRLCLSGLPIQDADCLERFRSLLARMQVAVPVRLLESALVEVPTLIGWLRPTILVPASVFMGLTPDQLDAILAHELAHVRRYDYLVNLFQTVIEIVLFYHPAVWWISRKLREERENCCDDIALELVQDRLIYVSALALLEEGRAMPLALSASAGSLLQRIRRIVNANDRKVSALPLGIMVLILMAVVGISIRTTRADAPTVATKPPANGSVPASLPESDVKVTLSMKGKLTDRSKESTDKDGWIGAAVTPIDLISGSLKFGQQGVLEQVRVFPYPVDFDAPENIKTTTYHDQPVIAVLPTTPTNFARENLGWRVTIMAEKGKAGIVKLSGVASFTSGTFSHGVYGENSGPIYKDVKNPQTGKVEHALISKNESHLPIFQTSVTPFFVFAKPGQSYVVKLQAGADLVEATIRCDLLEKEDGGATPKTDGTTQATDPTALLLAANSGDSKLVQSLLERGADPNAKGQWGAKHDLVDKPIAGAIANGNLEMAQLLLDHGAKADDYVAYALNGGNGKMVKLLWDRGVRSISELSYQISQGASVEDLTTLLDHGSPTDPPQDTVMTPLAVAAAFGNKPAVELLLAHGADPDKCGVFPADTWTRPGHSLPADLLLPLSVAAENGQDEVVEDLLKHGVHPTRQAILMAVQRSTVSAPTDRSRNHFENCVKLLINAGALKDVPADEAGKILYMSVYYGGGADLAVLKQLLDVGLSPQSPSLDTQGKPLIDYVRSDYQAATPVHAANLKPVLDMLEAADMGARPKTTDTTSDDSLKALKAAAQKGDMTEVQRLFKQRFDAELLRSARAREAGELSIAAVSGDAAHVGDLVKDGANVNETDNTGDTPLHYAIQGGHVDIAEFLLTHGANVNQFNSSGMTPKTGFDLMPESKDPVRAEMEWGASEKECQRRVTAFKELFAKYPSDPNYRDSHGRTALHQMAFSGNTMIVFVIRDKAHPADLNLRDADGNTPLALAALSPHARETGLAVSNYDSDKPSPQKADEETAETSVPDQVFTAWNAEAYIADKLIKAGARLDLKMPDGQTVGALALAAAVKAKNPQLISVLHEAGVAETSPAPNLPDAAPSPAGKATSASLTSSVLPDSTPVATAGPRAEGNTGPVKDAALQEAYILREVADLKSQLQLTPAQEAVLKTTMESVVQACTSHTPIVKTVDQAFKEILNPQQELAWQDIKEESPKVEAELMATNEMVSAAKLLHLNAAQKDKVWTALYQIALDAPTRMKSIRSPFELASAFETEAQAKEIALAKILTPDQYAIYTQDIQNDLHRQEVAMSLTPALTSALQFAPATTSALSDLGNLKEASLQYSLR